MLFQHSFAGPENKPEKLVEGWNVWFFDQQKELTKVWPYLRANQKSVGELWLGFLDYYARCVLIVIKKLCPSSNSHGQCPYLKKSTTLWV